MLLTRSPLIQEQAPFTVRLACVKHAASVRPEPGSNSPLKLFGGGLIMPAYRQLRFDTDADSLLNLLNNQRNPSRLALGLRLARPATGFVSHSVECIIVH